MARERPEKTRTNGRTVTRRRGMAEGGQLARRFRHAREMPLAIMHAKVEEMYKRAWLQALVGELRQRLCLIRREAIRGASCRPIFGRLARALGLTRWVSNQGVCRAVIALPGTEMRR